MYVLVAEFPDGGKISMIFGTASNALMNHDRYFAVFNMHTFLGRFPRNVFSAPFYTKNNFLPQDRLGTDIGKVEKKHVSTGDTISRKVAYYFPPAPVLRKTHIMHLRRHLIATPNDHHFAKTSSRQT